MNGEKQVMDEEQRVTNDPPFLERILEVQLLQNDDLNKIRQQLSTICEKLGCDAPDLSDKPDKPDKKGEPRGFLGRIEDSNKTRTFMINLINIRIEWLNATI